MALYHFILIKLRMWDSSKNFSFEISVAFCNIFIIIIFESCNQDFIQFFFPNLYHPSFCNLFLCRYELFILEKVI